MFGGSVDRTRLSAFHGLHVVFQSCMHLKDNLVDTHPVPECRGIKTVQNVRQRGFGVASCTSCSKTQSNRMNRRSLNCFNCFIETALERERLEVGVKSRTSELEGKETR